MLVTDIALLIIGFVLIPYANSIPQYRERVLDTSTASMGVAIALDFLLGMWIWKNHKGAHRRFAIALYWIVLGSLLGLLLIAFQKMLLS